MQAFTPLRQKPRVRKVGAFDLEGAGGPDGFESGCAMMGQDVIYTRQPGELVDYMRQSRYRDAHWYAHNLTYDLGVLLPHLDAEHAFYFVEALAYKGAVLGKGHHKMYLNDSLRMFHGLPLHTIGDAIGYPKYDTPPSLTDGEKQAAAWTCELHNRVHCLECYNVRDTEIVLRAMRLLQAELIELGGQMRDTLASSAMDLYRRSFMSQEYPTPFPYRNEWAREAYYGGRVEPFGLGTWDDVNVYDFHSLYPSVMYDNEFPDPATLQGPVSSPPPGVIERYEGISEVTVRVPKSHIPPLPYRYKDKLYFPYGKFRGRYTHAELRLAVEQGAVIEKVHFSLYATGTCRPFQSYVSTLYERRMELQVRADPRQLVYKMLLNSLYGKFGQRSDSGLRKLVSMEDWMLGDMPDGCEMAVYGNKEYVRKPISSVAQPAFVNVIWAAYIAAYARIKLYRAMLGCTDKVIYCDTDSIFTTGTCKVEDCLGGLKQEHERVQLEIYAPKVYRLHKDGRLLGEHAKGVPARAAADFMDHGVASFRRPLRFEEASLLGEYPSVWIWTVSRMLRKEPKRLYELVKRTPPPRYESAPFSCSQLPAPRPIPLAL